jgi:predicted amidohydrolase
MNIATVATDVAWKDVEKNIELTSEHVKKVKEFFPNVQVILFPEANLMGGLNEESSEFAQDLDGPAVTAIKNIAKENNVALICSIIEKNGDDKPYNCAFVISKDGKLLASYRKIHLFTEGKEPLHYSRGESLATFDIEGWKCGLSICFDIRFPRLYEAYKNAGVECMFSPNNWVDGRNKPAILENLVKARAHENQFFFASVDRSGRDPGTMYHGISVISNPYAEEISRKNGIYAYAELDKEVLKTLRAAQPLDISFKSNYTFND